MEISLVFPHQLYKENPCIDSTRNVILVEEFLYFKQYKFHKQKLKLHRATMQFYKDFLVAKNLEISYIESTNEQSDIRKLIEQLAKDGCKKIHFVEVVDFLLNKRLETACAKFGVELKEYQTPNFLNSMADITEYFQTKKTYFQTDFYTWQRKKRKILLESDGKPVGGKWTFDADNRSKFPKNEIIPTYSFPKENKYVAEASKYVTQNFTDNFGESASPFGNKEQLFYPTTFLEAEQWLENFLNQRFLNFGIYEDAMVNREPILYHSVLTPMLNVGLLLPQQIIDATLNYATKNEIPLNSLEGFVRQILGWREFIRVVYEREHVYQRTKNYWGFTRKIPKSFYDGTTGIIPLDDCIKKLLKSGYNHHIERLMVLGNFMLLCEFDPNEVYQWFMEMYVDAYDWVMVPNVYGMTQFADGGKMTTKPYISGSNYIMKMSNYEKGNWQNIWDGLFWHFMDKQRTFFLQNPRLGMLVGTFDKMDAEKKNKHLSNAKTYLNLING